jgi:hypothetical protein
MADIPQTVRDAVDAALDGLPQPENRCERDRWRIVSRITLEAAAPILAEHIAQAILAHAERQHPRGKDHVPTAWDRHFSIAARIAAGAFYTREDELRLAAEAIERGDVMWCNPPEVPGG